MDLFRSPFAHFRVSVHLNLNFCLHESFVLFCFVFSPTDFLRRLDFCPGAAWGVFVVDLFRLPTAIFRVSMPLSLNFCLADFFLFFVVTFCVA